MAPQDRETSASCAFVRYWNTGSENYVTIFTHVVRIQKQDLGNVEGVLEKYFNMSFERFNKFSRILMKNQF